MTNTSRESHAPANHLAVDAATTRAARAWGEVNPLRAEAPGLSDEARAAMLERIAHALDAHRADIIALAAHETALLPAELAPEFDRMTGTLRLFAAVARNGTWREAALDPAPVAPAVAIGPPHAVRVERIPLGPVAVFGASNFPLAYGVCGGDTASALAVGCPVIVKEHPAHPHTGRLIAKTAREAVASSVSTLPSPQREILVEGLFNYVEHANPDDPLNPPDPKVGAALVAHPTIRAAGFTGSLSGGMALDTIAQARPAPIPVFAEMGSVNPILVTPGALTPGATSPERAIALADELAASLLLRFGQQCTCPGVVFLPAGQLAEAFIARLASRVEAAPGRDMLAPWIARAFAARVHAVASIPGVQVIARGTPHDGPRGGQATLLRAGPEEWSRHHTLREELFGPAMLVITLNDFPALNNLPLPGTLTLSVYFDRTNPADAASARELVAHHGHSAGRVIANGVPTGVRACESMVHGGPFPATNCPDTTAVGPRAARRWTRPVCWQGAW